LTPDKSENGQNSKPLCRPFCSVVMINRNSVNWSATPTRPTCYSLVKLLLLSFTFEIYRELNHNSSFPHSSFQFCNIYNYIKINHNYIAANGAKT